MSFKHIKADELAKLSERERESYELELEAAFEARCKQEDGRPYTRGQWLRDNKAVLRTIGGVIKEAVSKQAKLTEAQIDMSGFASASVVGESQMRILALEKRPANTTLFADMNKKIAELTTKVEKQAQLISAANKTIATLLQKVNG